MSTKVFIRMFYDSVKVESSVSDPSHFDVDPDPDPGIHISEKWIRIRILGSTFP